MRIGIPTWQGTVSPVFDVARNLLLIDVEAGTEQSRRYEPLSEVDVLRRAARLRALSVNTLICVAVSWPLEQALFSCGVCVIRHVCGNVEDVLDAYLRGSLSNGAFRMPGCRNCSQEWGRGRRVLRDFAS